MRRDCFEVHWVWVKRSCHDNHRWNVHTASFLEILNSIYASFRRFNDGVEFCMPSTQRFAQHIVAALESFERPLRLTAAD